MNEVAYVQVSKSRNTGRYHRIGRCIRGREVTVERAKELGYLPCPICLIDKVGDVLTDRREMQRVIRPRL